MKIQIHALLVLAVICSVLRPFAVAKGNAVRTNCASENLQYQTCSVVDQGTILSVSLHRQLSNSECVESSTFGIDYNIHTGSMWVSNGCRGEFNVTTVSCDLGWMYFNGQCYKRVETYYTWSQASDHCMQLGAHLASIHSRAEQDFLVENVLNGASGQYWSGLHLFSGHWWWEDHLDPVDFNTAFSNWLNNEGEISELSGGCMLLKGSNWKWEDKRCHNSQKSLCQISVCGSGQMLNPSTGACELDHNILSSTSSYPGINNILSSTSSYPGINNILSSNSSYPGSAFDLGDLKDRMPYHNISLGLTPPPDEHLYLINTSPVRTGEEVTFLLFAEAASGGSYISDMGSGGQTWVDIPVPTANQSLHQLISTWVHLPFDPADALISAFTHTFSEAGTYDVQAKRNASGEYSQLVVETRVVIQHTLCLPPPVIIRGGGLGINATMPYHKKDRISLTGNINITCSDVKRSSFHWSVYTVGRAQDIIDQSNMLRLPDSVATSKPHLDLPRYTLPAGMYVAELQVTLHTSTDIVISTNQTWFTVVPSAILNAVITGGSMVTVGSEQVIRINASLSGDPDVKGVDTQLKFQWFCTLESQDFPKNLTAEAGSSGGCTGQGYSIGGNSSVLELPPGILPAGQSYVFRAQVTKDGHSPASADQQVKVMAGEPPQVRITCRQNCDTYLNPSQRLSLTTSCDRCRDLDTLTYTWSLVPQSLTNTRQALDWRLDTLTGGNKKNLVIRENVFSADVEETYSLRLEAYSRSSGSTGQTEYQFSTNSPPTAGQCTVSPSQGTVLVTKFSIQCTGFLDSHLPLHYEYRAKVNNRESLLYSGLEATMPASFLPLGDKRRGYRLDLMVTVKDSFEASTFVELFAKVEEGQMDNTALTGLTSGKNSTLSTLLLSGDTSAATQLISSVTSLLNSQSEKQTDTPGVSKLEREQLRTSLVESLLTVEVETVESLQQTSAALESITQVTEELSAEAQVSAATACKELSAFLTSEAGAELDTKTLEDTAGMIVSGLSNVMTAATPLVSSVNGSQGDMGQPGDISQEDLKLSKNVTLATMTALQDVKSAVLRTKVTGEEPTVVSTDSLSMALSKETPQDLMGGTVTDSGSSSTDVSSTSRVEFPPSLPLNTSLIDEVDIELVKFKRNPFTWANNSYKVTSAVSQMELKSDGSTLTVKNLDQPISIFVPVTGGTAQPINMTVTKDGLSMVNFEVTDDESTVVLYLEFDNSSFTDVDKEEEDAMLIVSLMQNSSQSDLTQNTSSWEVLKVFQIPIRNLSSTSGHYLLSASVPHLNLSSSSSSSSSSSLSAVFSLNSTSLSALPVLRVSNFQSRCLYWDQAAEHWEGNGCQVGPLTNPYLTHCQCSHLTAFASGWLIMPNTFNFLETVAKFAQLSENPVVTIFVASILGVYLLLLLWARRIDRNNKEKAMVISLPDNDPLATYTYTVSVFTGSRRGSGTTANITITLIGSNGESDPHLLSSPQRSKIFGQRGAVDFFIIKTAASLGEVKKIRLWHDNSGSDPAWFLSRVVIHDLKADQKFYFICHSWLAVDLGDGLVDQVFSNATDDDIRNFTHLFINKTKIGLTDGHLWFSIFARPTISHFTCVQRLSCCLCLLMTTMLTNIMFYQVDTGPAEKAVDLGTVKLTWSQFIIGVESALFMFPISILIVELFRLSKAKPSALETSWSDTNLDQQDDRHIESNVKYGKLKNISSIELEFKSPVESSVSLPAGSDEGALRSVVSDASTGFKSPIQSDQSVVPPGVQMEQSVMPPGGNYGRPDTPLHSFPLQSSSTYQSIVTNASSLSITAFKSPYPSTDEMGCTLVGHTVDARSFKSVISGGPSYGKLGDRPTTVQFHQEVEIIGGEGSKFPEDESANMTPSDNEVRSVEDVDIEIDPNWAGKENKGSGSKYFAHFKDEEGDQGTGGAPGQHFQDSPKDQEEEDDILPEYAFEAVSPDGMLPWWFIYIGWAFVGLTTLSCGFFTILYGLSYGFRTSISWVVSMLTSFFTSVLFIQPVKVIGLAVFFSLVFKMPDEAETVIDPKLVDALEHFGKEDSEKIQQIQLHLNQLRCDPRYKPPAHKTLKSAKQLRYQQKRMYAIIREVIGYIIYCWLLMLMAYGQRDPQVYYLNKSLTDLFVPNFMQVKTFDDFWVYVKDTAITNLYDQEDPGFLTTKAAYLVGSPRLLQIRVKGGTCKSPIGALAHMICASTYGPDTADKTSYNQSWQAPLMNGSVSADNLPWVYQTPAELQYMWQSGILGEYGHWGGYVADLGRTVEGATSLVQSLQDATWLNEGTRMVVLEFTAYNANVNQFTMISTLVEVSVGGGLVLTPTVSSMRLYRYLQQFNLFVMACEIIYCIYVLYFIVAECMALKERGWSYFISGWTWISISLISVSLAGIGTYIARSIVTIAVMERFKRDPSAFVNFEQTVLLDKALGYLIAVLVMLSSLKFISILRFNPVVHLLTQTFAKAAGQILWAVALVVAYFIAYAFLSNLIFGRHLYYFRNFRVSMESMFGFIRGGYDIEAMQEVHWLVAPFILMSFVIVVIYVFLALFIAILTSEIGVERQYGGPQEDADLIRLGIEKVRELLGLGRQKK